MNRLLLASILLLIQQAAPPPAHLPQQDKRFPEAQPGPADIVAAIFAPATGSPARPSAVVGFIAGKTIEMKSFGKLSPSGSRAPDRNTVYEIGSITKGLTGILLADMALSGDVSLHETLEKFLPDPMTFPEAVRTITLLQLATHASGLPRLPGNLMRGMKDSSNPYAHYDAQELHAFLRGYAPPPDRATVSAEYSNLGFGLLGYVLSRKAAVPYDALLRTRVLEPLGMKDTAIALSDDQRRRLAPGHAKGAAAGNWDLNALAGAGAVQSTVADMTRLLQALMRPPASRVGKAIALALEPRSGLGASRIGLGWLTSTLPDGRSFTWHNGGTGGYRSFIGFTQDRKAGIVVLANGSDDSPDPLAIEALLKLAAR